MPSADSDFLDHSDALARIPEHSIKLMSAFSAGKPFCIGPWLFFTSEDWLMSIGYPLEGKYTHEEFLKAFEQAKNKTGAISFFAIAPDLPPKFSPYIVDKDNYYVLSASASVPSNLISPIKKAEKKLKVTEESLFLAGHRRLWAEFMDHSGHAMTARVAELYSKTPQAIKHGNLQLLTAWDDAGNAVASLLLDYNPKDFVSYVLGAHSRKHYIPHATDLLFATLLKNAVDNGKRFINLGLGVNDGILRFKRKWGAVPQYSYLLAEWGIEAERAGEKVDLGRSLALALLNVGSYNRAKIVERPQSKPFAMLWRVEKDNAVSWIGGTAHFFYHNFEPSLRKLFHRVDNVIFEGSLDPVFMAAVDKAGKTLSPGQIPLIELMTEAEIAKLEKVTHGPRGKLLRILGMEYQTNVDVHWLLRNTQPWCAFFTLWTTFLERHGWQQSVDMEAWRLAVEMGKNVIGMENLEEQLESLSSLPVERVLRFFRDCGHWKKLARQNLHAYLSGDLEKMMGSSAEFPTRTEYIVSRRDQRFRERMRPWLEKGSCAVFVGSAHMVNLRHMLVEDGFKLKQVPFGLLPKIKLSLRNIFRPDEKITW